MTDRLRRSGNDYAQGFHIGMPRPIVAIFAPQ
jgi:EAL domain-containing protein (putative c-di-GMP-specific phosphodiesterase class I)